MATFEDTVRDEIDAKIEATIDPTIEATIEAQLAEGIQLAQQTSPARRLPAAPAVPLLSDARARLRDLVKREPRNERAWRLLSLAEETLLAYGAAVTALENAVALQGVRDKKDRKRLAALLTAATEWDALGLTPYQLEELGAAIVAPEDGQRTDPLARTRAYLRALGPAIDLAKVLVALSARGGVDDQSVLRNVVRGGVA